MTKDFEKIVKGVHCCMKQDDCCEDCPYVAAAEACGQELDADLEWMADAASEVVHWTVRALDWLRREEPDALITMVDRAGQMPEILAERVFQGSVKGMGNAEGGMRNAELKPVP